jgi:hypothetical protein
MVTRSTYRFWLNQVERWFGLLTQRALKRNSFKTVTELTRKIDSFALRVSGENAGAKDFHAHTSLRCRMRMVVFQ